MRGNHTFTSPFAHSRPGAHYNHVRPRSGEKVHWTFSCFGFAPSTEGGLFLYMRSPVYLPVRSSTRLTVGLAFLEDATHQDVFRFQRDEIEFRELFLFSGKQPVRLPQPGTVQRIADRPRIGEM